MARANGLYAIEPTEPERPPDGVVVAKAWLRRERARLFVRALARSGARSLISEAEEAVIAASNEFADTADHYARVYGRDALARVLVRIGAAYRGAGE